MSKRTGKVQFTKRPHNLHGFRVRASNSEIVHGDHQGYATQHGAVRGLYALQRAVNEAVANYEKSKEIDHEV